jgi:hypothetical protein
MRKMPVRKWLKVQRSKHIYIGQVQEKRLGDTNIKKILRFAPKVNKSIEIQTQNIEDFVTNDIANIPFIKKID